MGHIRTLQFAKSQGEKLIVGLNSDASARRLKGMSRPIQPAAERQELLLAIRAVDEVCIFEEDTPEQLIIDLVPQVLVKGPDTTHPIPGAEFVTAMGGKVILPPWSAAKTSTTAIIERIRRGDADYPWPRQAALYVNGERVRITAQYSLRFTDGPDGSRPVLYAGGRRVTAPWKIELAHEQPGDKYGVSG